MPKRKQPPPLLKMATDRLIDFLAERCDECSINGSLEELRQVVAFMKEDIGPIIPWLMRADFLETFLCKYFYGFKPREERPESHKRAVLEVIMDRKIVGLDLRFWYFPESTDLEDIRRIRGLRTLELSGSRLHYLETFHLEDLEEFFCGHLCTDTDLQIIAKNCPKLKHLTIEWSEQVTDNGLYALNKCTELRTANFWPCPNITDRGIQQFLEAHEKFEKIRADSNCFSDEGWSVYPSITKLEDYNQNITNSDLRCIVEKLPNLVRLKIYGQLDDSACLSTLGSLEKLTHLTFEPEGDVIIWAALKPLLRTIGAQITELHASSWGRGSIARCITEADLDFLYKFCPNIESLSFDYNPRAHGRMLVIPPFGRLRELKCSNSLDHPDYVQLQFGVMANLKTLQFDKFEVTTEDVESIILDNDHFPELNCIDIYGVPSGCDLDRIREINQNNNIDARID